MITYKPGISYCPYCANILDAVSTSDGHPPPQPGDGTFCAFCGAILQFGPKYELRKVSIREFYTLPVETRNKLLLYHHEIVNKIRIHTGKQSDKFNLNKFLNGFYG